MEALLDHLVRLLLAVGPWIVFAATLVETAFFVGLLVPAEATVLLAAALADAGKFELADVTIATLLGAFCGDQIGYLLGRYGGNRVIARGGHVARLWRRYEPVAARLFRRHAMVAVTIARFISFVRTLMPWFAGMSEMKYRQFLFYDILGVLGWGIASIALGYAAGASWRVLADRLGVASAIVLGAVLVVLAAVALRRRLAAHAALRNGLLRVGLTGNIASGKSTVAEIWRSLGAEVIDADVLAREVIAPGTAGYREVVRTFGEQVVRNGEIDRGALREIVFADESKRRALEAIIHPEVGRRRRAQEVALARAGARIVVNDIPLLFEAGLQKEFDVVVLVDAPEGERIERIVRTRGLERAEAERMVAAQMPAHDKRVPATYVIENDGTLEELRAQAERVWTEIRELAQ